MVVEAGAGADASQPDAAYLAAGVTIADAAAVWGCDVVAKVNAVVTTAVHVVTRLHKNQSNLKSSLSTLTVSHVW